MLTSCQTKILEIVWDCPLQKPLKNCPFNLLRNKSLDEQIKVIELLTEEEEELLFRHHFTCRHYRYLK